METAISKSHSIEKLLKEIKELETEFSEILLSKKNIEQKLYIFKLEYDEKISPYYLEKIKVDVEINKLLQKRGIPLDRFEKDNRYHPDIADEELYKEQKEYFEQQNAQKEKIEENIKKMSEDETNDLKKLYKKLAMKFHPDRFANEPEKQPKAVELMQQINQAFQEQDFEKLQRIATEGFDLESNDDELSEETLIIRKNELENNISNIQIDIEIIYSSDIYQLYEKYITYGEEDFYKQIIEESTKEIEEAKKLLQILEEMK